MNVVNLEYEQRHISARDKGRVSPRILSSCQTARVVNGFPAQSLEEQGMLDA